MNAVNPYIRSPDTSGSVQTRRSCGVDLLELEKSILDLTACYYAFYHEIFQHPVEREAIDSSLLSSSGTLPTIVYIFCR